MELGQSSEITIKVSVTARPSYRFDAVATATVGGEKFEGSGTDTTANAAIAIAHAVAALAQLLQQRQAKFVELGPDVLLRKRAKKVREDLGLLFQHPDPPYKSAPWARPRASLPPAPPAATTPGRRMLRPDADEIGRRSAGPVRGDLLDRSGRDEIEAAADEALGTGDDIDQ